MSWGVHGHEQWVIVMDNGVMGWIMIMDNRVIVMDNGVMG